jgi:hypothetical protein
MSKFVQILLTGEPLAGVATIAGILAFIAAHRPLDRNPNDSSVWGFLAYWWPELVFYACMFLILLYLGISYFSPKPINIQHHRFTFIRVPGQPPVYPRGSSSVEVFSEEEHFTVQLAGKIFGPELVRVLAHFRTKSAGATPSSSVGMVYMLVSELTRSGEERLWWPQNPVALAEDGSYEANCHLGGTGIDSADNSEVFELRTYIPMDRSVTFQAHSCFDSITGLPKTLFLRARPKSTSRVVRWRLC